MHRSLLIVSLCTLPFAPLPVQAQDASFGCKVLLCAAAAAPGWGSIPYCVPVMQTLFRQLAKGKGWPLCSEGNASGLGYEPYQACQSGLPYQVTQTATSNGSDGSGQSSQTTYVADANGSVCIDAAVADNAPCLTASPNTSGNSQCATLSANYSPVARSARENPYFVDITPKNSSPSRFYFSLTGQ